MTICIASDSFFPQVGGIATFNQHLVQLLTQAGHKALVLVIDYDGPEDGEDSVITESNFIKVTLAKSYFNYYKKWKPYFRPGGFNAPNWIAMGLAMQEWLSNNHHHYDIDIIEASDYGGIGIFLCRDDLPPLVITGHGSLLQLSRFNEVIRDDSFNVLNELERLSFVHADTIITHSLINKRDLEELFKRKVELAPIPWHATTIKTGVSQNPSQMLVVGGLQPVKGLYDMAESMLLLRERDPSIQLDWVGPDTWLAPGQHKMSEYMTRKYQSIWQKTFIWKNEYSFDQTQEAIASAGLIVIPAVFETFNYITLEAAWQKKPIIITEKTGAALLFTHAHDAWIIPVNEPRVLADAILKLKGDPALCHQLGENAYQTVLQQFEPGKILEERLKIYRSTLALRTKKDPSLHRSLIFLNRYKSSFRKYYYCTRRLLKRLAGKT